jgi:phage protein D
MAVTLSPASTERAADAAESVEIAIDGQTLGEEWLGMLSDVQVRDNLMLPDTAVVRFRDPHGDKLTSNPLKLGVPLVIKLGAAPDRAPAKLFEGEIVALEPEFRADEAVLAARAFDKGHRLNRKRESFTYLNKKAEDIVAEVAGRNGLPTGTIDSTSTVHQHLQQSQQTDWDFCWMLARMNGFEFAVTEGKVNFCKRATQASAMTLRWLDNLNAFRARASAVGQVADVTVANHDPKARQATTSTISQAVAAGTARILQERDRAISALGGGSARVADRVATSTDEAQSMAQGVMNRMASAFLEADGIAHGSPKLRAGATVTIEGVGDFSGDYLLSATTHRFKGGHTYTTQFEISGDRSRSLIELMGGHASSSSGGGGGGAAAGGAAGWGGKLVIGAVTNNNDPDNMGRVKVQFDDEVVVGFEHGDTRRPFVLGSLYTGKEPLPDDLKDADKREAKFGVKTDNAFLAHSSKELKLHSGEKMTIEVHNEASGATGDFKLDAVGNVEQNASKNFKATASQSIELQANQSVTVKGQGSVTIEAQGSLKLQGATIDIQANGPVNVKGAMINLG